MYPEESERKPWPPAFWKAPQPLPPPVPEPPITRRVILPEKVAVRFLAEESGQRLNTIVSVMNELRITVDVNRSLDFDDAAKVLRRYGIAAERQL